MKKMGTVSFLALWACALPAAERAVEFQPAQLKSMDCQVQVPAAWTVYDEPVRGDACSWVITPDDRNKADYQTGVRIDSLAHVTSQTGVKASKWVAERVSGKAASLPVLSSETGPTNEYFQVRRLVTEEVYSPGRTEYITCRKSYSWYWNDQHDVVVCVEARTPEKSWKSMSAILEKMGSLEFDVVAWKKKLAVAEE